MNDYLASRCHRVLIRIQVVLLKITNRLLAGLINRLRPYPVGARNCELEEQIRSLERTFTKGREIVADLERPPFLSCASQRKETSRG